MPVEIEALPVTVEGLRYGYAGRDEVLRGVDWRIGAGEKVALFGRSGAGKSTLLLQLNGILKPHAGRVLIGDCEVRDSTLERIRRDVGLVFQNPDDQLFHMTVEEDIAFGPRNLGWSEDEVRSHVHEAAAAMRLDGLLGQHPQQLSSGERKRAALATVLAMRPRVIAMDEPFANLDPELIEQLIGTIRELKATVIVISQAILPALACCKRAAVLNEGQMARCGPAIEIAKDRELLGRCGLDFHHYREIWRQLENGASPG